MPPFFVSKNQFILSLLLSLELLLCFLRLSDGFQIPSSYVVSNKNDNNYYDYQKLNCNQQSNQVVRNSEPTFQASHNVLFQRYNQRQQYDGIIRRRLLVLGSLSASATNDDETSNVIDDWDEERKANLFQFLLRDLQVEGVPLLSVDGANQVHTMQAAIWSTIAELYDQYNDDVRNNNNSKNNKPMKVCLIFDEQSIPISALRAFVDDYLLAKTQNQRFIDNLPEIQNLSISLVGKGIGPAIVIEIDGTTTIASNNLQDKNIDPNAVIDVMKTFVHRVMHGMNVCPYYTESSNDSNTNYGYRVCTGLDVIHVMSSFWNCICELSTTSSAELSSIILCMPNASGQQHNNDHSQRFAAISEFISRNLCLYRGDSVYELLYFDPTYARDNIYPADQPAHGHLPPTKWIHAMITTIDPSLLDDDKKLYMSNYQRRSPVMAVCVKRISQLEEVASIKGVTELNIDGQTVPVPSSIVTTQVQNTRMLTQIGQDQLQSSLQNEMNSL